MQGNNIIAKSLAQQDLKHCFGIVGVPVIELGSALQAEGINYYGCRNEQGASYSAQAIGYLTGKPGICLTVSGPGMVHAMAGITNAWSNGFPMILISGASDINQDGKGGFQECNQLGLAQPYCKFAYRVTDMRQIPFIIQKAVKLSIQGRPGPVYLEFPGDILSGALEEDSIKYQPQISEQIKSQAPDILIEESLKLLQQSKNPQLLQERGAQLSHAEKSIQEFVDKTNLPFLPTPMGKGVVSDLHPQCVGSARSTALGQADVILLIGARLNWILHFGQPPRFQKNVKIIQIDILPEEFDTNVKGQVNLLGDCDLIMKQFNQSINKKKLLNLPKNSEWWTILNDKIEKNKHVSNQLLLSQKLPMTHYSSLHIINQNLPKEFFYVGEGANTMDIGRTIIPQTKPRTKLDAGSYGTMGIGIPYAIAAQIENPELPVVAILGDSAFGFSAMELETASRYKLPLIIFILNNNGIFFGHDSMPDDELPLNLTPLNLKVDTRYEKMAEAFDGKGHFVKTHSELEKICQEVFDTKNPNYRKQITIINVMIDPFGARKPQEHQWLTKETPNPKL